MSTVAPLPSPMSTLSQDHEKASLETTPRSSRSHQDVDLEPGSTNFDDSTVVNHPSLESKSSSPKKDLRFWLVFLSICCSMFLSALDLTSVSTALPAIAADFQTTEYAWVGSAYTLASTALIPWTASFATIFGRRPIMVASISTFALGSALTGAAQNVPMLIAGRTIQGVGGGAILTICDMLIVDLVPIAERGAYFGIIGAVWALASAMGPPIGGALASAGQWRWLFYLNLPVCGVAILLTIFCLKIKAPKTTWQEKVAQIDWLNIIFVPASTAAILGLVWGGVAYSWSSYKVLVPLILGLACISVFIYLEKFAKHPTVPFEILTTRTAISGYVTTFLHSVVVLAVLYFLPIYFQADKGDTPIQSGVSTFSLSFTIAPLAMIAGVSVGITGHYKLQNVLGWMLAVIGTGLMTLLEWDSVKAAWVGYPVIVGCGVGLLYSATNFAVLAPVTPAQQPLAIAFYGFSRNFGQVFGIAIGSTILQNRLNSLLPRSFAAEFGSGEIAFAVIPVIKGLPEPLRTQVRVAFADSIRTIWYFVLGVAGLGFVVSLVMKSLPLTMERDENWGVLEKEKVTKNVAA
ncbi:hypothetical protein JCM10212_001210 [Sporobolomyces blumeae]